MSGIFISYRREDSGMSVGRLADALGEHFGRERVFQDISSIDPGADFIDALKQALADCAAALVVIGPKWLTATDRKGRRRLDDPNDWVRQEIVEALSRPGLRVFPLLVEGAEMPTADELPDVLKPLARRQAYELTVRHWTKDVAVLVDSLKRVPALGALPRPGEARVAPEPVSAAGLKSPAYAVDLRPGKVFRDAADTPEMVVIPAGQFMMGSPESEAGRFADEGPQHRVRIAAPFALGRYAVTVGEFGRFATATGYKTEAERTGEGIIVLDGKGSSLYSKGKGWRDPGFAQDEHHPVVGVSWNDALAYVDWLAQQTGRPYRLPSEAEWEYAARAGTTTARYWGEDPNQAAGYANVGDRTLKAKFPEWPWTIHECDDGYAHTAPVGSFQPNGFGLYDMLGNVWEWTQDCWNGSYEGAPADGSAWEFGDCGRRVVRGGSWINEPESARAVYRSRNVPTVRLNYLGFRLARTL